MVIAVLIYLVSSTRLILLSVYELNAKFNS